MELWRHDARALGFAGALALIRPLEKPEKNEGILVVCVESHLINNLVTKIFLVNAWVHGRCSVERDEETGKYIHELVVPAVSFHRKNCVV